MAAHSTTLRQGLPVSGQGFKPCDCKSRVEQLLLEQFKASDTTATGHRVSLQGYGLAVVGNTMRVLPFMQFKASADYPTKRNVSRFRAKVGVMHFSFCPFCGKPLKAQTGEGG